MAGQDNERRLAAIMVADVAGYSRLMGADESGTLAALKALRKDVFAPRVAAHKGRVVKLMGDGALVEFPSIVNAVDCAIAVQRALAARPTEAPLKLRIGITLGDIIIEGSDIYGDGVNLAARIQEVAEPGGMALSAVAHDQVAGKVEATFADGGEHNLKNIAKPVRIYHWSDDADRQADVADTESSLPLPDKPSIAVLPFVNMSGDHDQEYFSDGITEDIITELSRFRSLFVIARNSSFAFREKSVDVSEVGRKLGVQYVVEGSVRKAGNRVRVTVQLIEAETGNHIWAERYDRELEDIFAVQDEVTRTIVGTLVGRLQDTGAQIARRKPTENMACYDYLLRGNHHIKRYTRDDNAAARPLIEKAIELDPDSARAHAALGIIDVMDWMWDVADDDALDRALASAQKAMALDDVDSLSYVVSAHVCIRRGRHGDALNYMAKAVVLNPNDPSTTVINGFVLACVGHHDEAIEWIETGMRLDPFHPDWMLDVLGMAFYVSKRYDEAIDAYRRMKAPPYWIHRCIAACLAQLGRTDEACDEVAAYHDAADHVLSAVKVRRSLHEMQVIHRAQDDRDLWLEGYRKAGFDM